MGFTVCVLCGWVCFVPVHFMLFRDVKGTHAQLHSQEMGIFTMKRSDYLTRYCPGSIWCKTELC
jgi:hypothetical protein